MLRRIWHMPGGSRPATDNFVDRLLDEKVRVGTSTPGADPGGDYAFAMFRLAEKVREGAAAKLSGKALKLVGGGSQTPLLVQGKGAVEGVFIADKADVMIVYCSGARTLLKELPDLDVVRLPARIAVGPAYGLVVLTTKPVAARFVNYVMSEAGQSLLREFGFDPVASPAVD